MTSVRAVVRVVGGGLMVILLLLCVPKAMTGQPIARTRFTPEIEALIAKHELAPGLTRVSAIDFIGTDWIEWDGSSWRAAALAPFLGPGAGAWINTWMTPEMVTASWGTPDATGTTGIGQEYIYRQPPDGEIHAQFNDVLHPYETICIFVDTVLAPEYFNRRFPAWTDAQCTLVAAGKVTLGMTQEMARMALGKPSRVHRSVGSWGVHEQWVYDSSSVYLYFENGILTSWQDSG